MDLLLDPADLQTWYDEAAGDVDRAIGLAVAEIERRAADGDAAAETVLSSWVRGGARQALKPRFLALDQRLVANGIVEQTRMPARLGIRKTDGSTQLTAFAALTRAEAEAVFQAQMAQVRTRQRWLTVMRQVFTAWDQRPDIATLGEACAAAGVDLRSLELAA